MIKLQGKLPRQVYPACSGGVDSMVALHLKSNPDVKVLHSNGTGHGEEAEKFIVDYCRRNDIPCLSE